jgi:hypothetical protein
MAGTTTPIADGPHAADAAPDQKSEPPAVESAIETVTQVTHRRQRPRIDLDDSIAAARETIKQAQQDMVEARRTTKNEKRQKQRTLRKAAALSSEELQRIY